MTTTVGTAAAGSRAALCAHENWSPLYGGLLQGCPTCDVFVTASAPEVRYDESYFTAGDGDGYDFDSDFAQDNDRARFVAELQRLEARGLKGSLLDIGCATGAFLFHAQARGWDVTGAEMADYARANASKRIGKPVAATLEELPAGARYDVVTLHHVLEHVDDPLPFLRDAVRPRVGRLLLVEVPNFASLASRRDGPGWRDLRPDQHIFHYAPRSLARLAERAGFEVQRVYSLWEPLWTLYGARQTLSLAGQLGRPRHDVRPADGPRAAGDDPRLYRRPSGARGVAVSLSRIALWPLVRALEARGLAERLVLEATPRPQH